MGTKTDKRAYSKPRILRVQLSPEQAVLSACYAGGVSLASNLNFTCNSNKTCKRWKDTAGDNAATS